MRDITDEFEGLKGMGIAASTPSFVTAGSW